MVAGISQLARRHLLEEESNVTNLRFLVERFRQFPFFLRAGGVSTSGFGPPPIVQDEDRVVALLQFLVDDCLRTSGAARHILPTDWVECSAARLGMDRGKPVKLVAKPFALPFQATR